MKIIASFLALLFLSACALQTPAGGGNLFPGLVGGTAPTTPIAATLQGDNARKALYTVSASVVALGNLALAYGNLPSCPQATVICKEPAIHAEIFRAYAKADAALSEAERFVRERPADDATAVVRAAQSALVVLQELTDRNAINATLARTQNQGSN